MSWSASVAASSAPAATGVVMITIFGEPTGLSIALLIAGLAGSLASLGLLSRGEGFQGWRTFAWRSANRIGIAAAASVTGAYLAPMVVMMLGLTAAPAVAFIIGASAQQILKLVIARVGGSLKL
jgi:hypothetical protein